MNEFGRHYRLLSLCLILTGVIILMLDHLQINLPLFAVWPAFIASVIIIAGTLIIILDHERREIKTQELLKHITLIRDYHRVIMTSNPNLSAEEWNKKIMQYAETINFREFCAMEHVELFQQEQTSCQNRTESVNDENSEQHNNAAA